MHSLEFPIPRAGQVIVIEGIARTQLGPTSAPQANVLSPLSVNWAHRSQAHGLLMGYVNKTSPGFGAVLEV